MPASTGTSQAHPPICASPAPLARTRQVRGPIRQQCAAIVLPASTQEIPETTTRRTAAYAILVPTQMYHVLQPVQHAKTVLRASTQVIQARGR